MASFPSFEVVFQSAIFLSIQQQIQYSIDGGYAGNNTVDPVFTIQGFGRRETAVSQARSSLQGTRPGKGRKKVVEAEPLESLISVAAAASAAGAQVRFCLPAGPNRPPEPGSAAGRKISSKTGSTRQQSHLIQSCVSSAGSHRRRNYRSRLHDRGIRPHRLRNRRSRQ